MFSLTLRKLAISRSVSGYCDEFESALGCCASVSSGSSEISLSGDPIGPVEEACSGWGKGASLPCRLREQIVDRPRCGSSATVTTACFCGASPPSAASRAADRAIIETISSRRASSCEQGIGSGGSFGRRIWWLAVKSTPSGVALEMPPEKTAVKRPHLRCGIVFLCQSASNFDPGSNCNLDPVHPSALRRP